MNTDNEQIADTPVLNAAALKQVEALKNASWLPKKTQPHVQHIADDHANPHSNDNKPKSIGEKADKESAHIQKEDMIERIEELLKSYGLDPAVKPRLLTALAKLQSAHTDAEIIAAIADTSPTISAAEGASADVDASPTFEDFEKKFDATWNKYDQLEKENRTFMQEATKAGYLSKEEEEKSEKEQKDIEEHKKELDRLRAEIKKMPAGEAKEEAEKEYQKKAHELTQEALQHTNQDKTRIEQTKDAAIQGGNDDVVRGANTALQKNDTQRQLLNSSDDAWTDKRQAAIEKMKMDNHHELSDAPAKPYVTANMNDLSAEPPKPKGTSTATDLAIEPPKPSVASASTDLAKEPPKPTGTSTPADIAMSPPKPSGTSSTADLPTDPPKPTGVATSTNLTAEPPKPVGYASADVNQDALGDFGTIIEQFTPAQTQRQGDFLTIFSVAPAKNLSIFAATKQENLWVDKTIVLSESSCSPNHHNKA